MFKGLFLILIVGFVIVLVIIAIVASLILRTVHRVKKVLNGESPNDDDYNPEINKKRQRYTYKTRTYGGGGNGFSQANGNDHCQGNGYSESQANDEHIHKSNTGEELYEMRNEDQVNRQIFSSEEGEYVEFTEESNS